MGWTLEGAPSSVCDFCEFRHHLPLHFGPARVDWGADPPFCIGLDDGLWGHDPVALFPSFFGEDTPMPKLLWRNRWWYARRAHVLPIHAQYKTHVSAFLFEQSVISQTEFRDRTCFRSAARMKWPEP